jgi:hypothetical protein
MTAVGNRLLAIAIAIYRSSLRDQRGPLVLQLTEAAAGAYKNAPTPKASTFQDNRARGAAWGWTVIMSDLCHQQPRISTVLKGLERILRGTTVVNAYRTSVLRSVAEYQAVGGCDMDENGVGSSCALSTASRRLQDFFKTCVAIQAIRNDAAASFVTTCNFCKCPGKLYACMASSCNHDSRVSVPCMLLTHLAHAHAHALHAWRVDETTRSC